LEASRRMVESRPIGWALRAWLGDGRSYRVAFLGVERVICTGVRRRLV